MTAPNKHSTKALAPAPAAAGLLALAAGLAACGGGEADLGYTVTDSAGIEIVESIVPAWADSIRRVDPEPALRIGRESEGPYQFGALRNGVFLVDGSIAVADAMADEVRVFDGDGDHLATYGGAGSGPGEFSSLAGVFRFRGDSILAFDQRQRRTTIFARSSDRLRTLPNQVSGNYMVFGVMDDATLLFFNPGQLNLELQPGLQWDSTDVVAMDPATGESRALIHLPVLQRLIGPGARREQLVPQQVAVQAAAPDGFYWGLSDRYEIRRFDGDGRVRRIMRRPVEPRPMSQALFDEYVAHFLDWAREAVGEGALAIYRRDFAAAMHGETVPLFGRAFVDADGRLWVGESNFPAFQGAPRRWSVFSDRGVWLGDVIPPDRLTLVDARGDTILGFWRDEMDVPYVQLHVMAPATD